MAAVEGGVWVVCTVPSLIEGLTVGAFGFDPLALVEGTPGEVEVHVRGFEEVVGDFHLVCYRPDNVGTDMSLVIERLQPAPDACVFILSKLRFLRVGGVRGGGVDVDPLFHLDGAGAVVELVGDVGGLGADVTDLADEGDLHYFDVVDAEFAFFVRLTGFKDLFYGDGAEGFSAVGGLWEISWGAFAEEWKKGWLLCQGWFEIHLGSRS